MPIVQETKNQSHSVFYAFNQESAHLQLSWGERCALYIKGWRDGLEWGLDDGQRNNLEKPSAFIGPDIDHFLNNDHPEVLKWWASFPEDLAQGLSIYKSNRFDIAKLCRDFKAAGDLLVTNPVLLFIVCLTLKRFKLNQPQVALLLQQKQTIILKQLGFHESKTSIKFLKKINTEHGLTKDHIARIMTVLKDEEKVKVFRHFSSVNVDAFEVLQKYEWMAGEKILVALNDMYDDQQRKEIISLIGDAVYMCRYYGWSVKEKMGSCSSASAIRSAHDKIAETDRELRAIEILKENERRGNSKTPRRQSFFSKPPHPGNEFIKPLIGRAAILEEGGVMKHCIASFTERVKKGTYFVYKMEQPQRLTIGVRVTKARLVKLDQVRGYRNQFASKDAAEIIKQWISDVKRDHCSSINPGALPLHEVN